MNVQGTAANEPGHARATDGIWLLLGALVVLAVHGWIAAFDYTASTFSDSIDYLMMADFYRAALFGGGTEEAASYYRGTRFPPVFPMLLGAAGGGSEHQHAAAIASNLIAVAALFAVWVWVRQALRSAAFATFAAVSTVLLPAWFTLNLSPVSEPLGLLIAVLCFLLLARNPADPRRVMVAALLIGIAPLARTALLPLVIAFAIWLFATRPLSWRATGVAVLLSWTPYLGWSAYRSRIGATQYTDYLSAQSYADAGVTLPNALWEQPVRLVQALVEAWHPSDAGAPLLAVAGLVLLLAGIGCVARMRRMHIDAWFVAGYVALILIWPYPREFTRFIAAIYPCVLVCAITGVEVLAARLTPTRRRWLAGAVIGSAMLACVPTLLRYAHRASLPVAAELLGDKREFEFFNHPTDLDALAAAEITGRSRLLLEEARALVPEDACIYTLLPQFTRMYSGRSAVRYPLDLYAGRGSASSRLTRCDYFAVGSWRFAHHGLPSFYPAEELVSWARPLLASEMQVEGRTHLVAALFERTGAEASGSTDNTGPAGNRPGQEPTAEDPDTD